VENLAQSNYRLRVFPDQEFSLELSLPDDPPGESLVAMIVTVGMVPTGAIAPPSAT